MSSNQQSSPGLAIIDNIQWDSSPLMRIVAAFICCYESSYAVSKLVFGSSLDAFKLDVWAAYCENHEVPQQHYYPYAGEVAIIHYLGVVDLHLDQFGLMLAYLAEKYPMTIGFTKILAIYLEAIWRLACRGRFDAAELILLKFPNVMSNIECVFDATAAPLIAATMTLDSDMRMGKVRVRDQFQFDPEAFCAGLDTFIGRIEMVHRRTSLQSADMLRRMLIDIFMIGCTDMECVGKFLRSRTDIHSNTDLRHTISTTLLVAGKIDLIWNLFPDTDKDHFNQHILHGFVYTSTCQFVSKGHAEAVKVCLKLKCLTTDDVRGVVNSLILTISRAPHRLGLYDTLNCLLEHGSDDVIRAIDRSLGRLISIIIRQSLGKFLVPILESTRLCKHTVPMVDLEPFMCGGEDEDIERASILQDSLVQIVSDGIDPRMNLRDVIRDALLNVLSNNRAWTVCTILYIAQHKLCAINNATDLLHAWHRVLGEEAILASWGVIREVVEKMEWNDFEEAIGVTIDRCIVADDLYRVMLLEREVKGLWEMPRVMSVVCKWKAIEEANPYDARLVMWSYDTNEVMEYLKR